MRRLITPAPSPALAHPRCPFYDGNGRIGHIVNVLYLVKERLLDIPVLYLSTHIVGAKGDYYRLLPAMCDQDA